MSDVVQISLVRSMAGVIPKHRKTVRALGLRKIGQTVEKKSTPAIMGMIKSGEYMLKWQEKN